MSTQIKIVGGTPTEGPSLCRSCKHGVVIKGRNCEERIVCTEGLNSLWGRYAGVVEFNVSDCTRYADANTPSLSHMEDIAWTVEARKRGATGFAEGVDTDLVMEISPPKKTEKKPWGS